MSVSGRARSRGWRGIPARKRAGDVCADPQKDILAKMVCGFEEGDEPEDSRERWCCRVSGDGDLLVEILVLIAMKRRYFLSWLNAMRIQKDPRQSVLRTNCTNINRPTSDRRLNPLLKHQPSNAQRNDPNTHKGESGSSQNTSGIMRI